MKYRINTPEALGRLNSMTKYPSILTYHKLGERQKLTDIIQVPFDDDDDVIITEKIDGTNARIIYLPDDDFFIGSREELLHAKGDRIWIGTGGIVNAIRDMSNSIRYNLNNVCVIYGEVFGGKVSSGSKNYTGHKNVGFRIFDILLVPRPQADDMILGNDNWTRQRIASWRDHGGQVFQDSQALLDTAIEIKQELTPRLCAIKGKDLPKSHQEMLDWLKMVTPKTQACLDNEAKAKSEGVVIRTPDRSKIAKIRYEDYERTLRAPQK